MNWTREFPQQADLIYLNHAAVSPWPARTRQAVATFAEENVVQGAQLYPVWLKTEGELRSRLQRIINAPGSTDISLLKNTSEALSVIAYGIDWQAGDNVVISNHEFPSNRIVWESLSRFGVEVKVADLDSGDSPEDAVIGAMDSKTRLLSISSVQYASGLKLNCSLLGEACKARNILFCIDAIQSIGAHEFDVQAYQADFVVADGHKWMLGPEGLALFYSAENVRDRLQLQQFGWHMVKHRGDYDRTDWEPAQSALRFECGSPNMLGAYALNASLSLLEEVGMKEVEAQLQSNMDYLISGLRAISGIHIISNTDPQKRAGIVTFEHQAHDSTKLHNELMQAGIICAHRGGGVRFSPHFYTPKDKIDRALAFLSTC